VALIEDDPVLARSLAQRLRLEGVTTWWARSAAEGEALLRRHRPTLVVCDMRLPDGSGEALLARLMPELGGVPVVVVTAYGGVDQAVRLMRLGVDDYLTKPFPVQRLLDKLAAFAAGGGARGAAGGGGVGGVEEAAGAPMPAPAEDPELGWRSAPMRALAAALARLAPAEATVLLSGESGAGKGVAAARLHALGGARAAEPFVVVDCAALPASTPEAEALLFGRGEGPAGTAGLAERAGAGTLFLDEVAELSRPLQARLLRLLEERRFLRSGGQGQARPLRARVVASTNADLPARVAAGAFREDLWFRLAVVRLEVPPLRERPEDLDALAEHFLRRFAAGRAEPAGFGAEAVEALRAHAWPGNVRELRNRVERASLLAVSSRIGAADLFPERAVGEATPIEAPEAGAGAEAPAAARAPEPLSLSEARDLAEREHIRRVLAHCGGRIAHAARALGVSRTTLWERMRRLGIPGR
jgi:DNA-binding NtrC family response regulator